MLNFAGVFFVFHPGPPSVHIPQFDTIISATSGQNGAEMIKTYLTSVKNHAEATTGVGGVFCSKSWSPKW